MSKHPPIALDKHSDTILRKDEERDLKKTSAKKTEESSSHKKLDTGSVETIRLQTKNGDSLELTSSKLDQWFAKTDDSEQGNDSELVVSQLLSHYGLQTSKDVINFLKTPAGETVKTMILEKLIELAAQRDYENFQRREEQARHDRMMAFLLLGLLHKHDAKAKHLNEAIQQQIDEKLHQGKSKDETAYLQTTEQLDKRYKAYEESANALQSTLANKQLEYDDWNAEMQLLLQDHEEMQQRHAIFEQNLNKLDLFFSEYQLSIGDETKAIENEINRLESKLEKQATDVSKHLVENRPLEAKQLMHKHFGTHLRVEGLKDMLAVKKGEKVLFDAEGNETGSFQKAAFTLTPDKKVVKEDGKFYLINSNQNLSDLSDKMKAEAALQFDKQQPEISMVRNRVRHNCKLENDFHGQRMQSAEKRGRSIEAEMTLLGNQLNQVRAAQAAVAAELRKPAPDLRKAESMQHAMPNLSASTPRTKASVGTGMTVNQSLETMIRNPDLQNINNFRSALINTYGAGPVNSTLMQQALSKIRPGHPITPAVMVTLTRGVYKLGLTLLETQEPKPEPEPEKRQESIFDLGKTPTPYKT